jgi:hypothetical protein
MKQKPLLKRTISQTFTELDGAALRRGLKRIPVQPQEAKARFAVVITPALLDACRKAASRARLPLSQWVRRVTAEAAGCPDLAVTRSRGKPKGAKP